MYSTGEGSSPRSPAWRNALTTASRTRLWRISGSGSSPSSGSSNRKGATFETNTASRWPFWMASIAMSAAASSFS